MATFANKVNNRLPENLLIVDLMNFCFRYKHNGSNKFAAECENQLRSIATSYDAGTILVMADWGGSTYRKEVYPEYKANRKELVEKQTAEEKEESRKFFNEYERTVEHLNSCKGMKLFRYKGVEADDLASFVCIRLHDLGYKQAWLLSSDRDWDLLVGEHVSRFSHVTRKETTLDTWDYEVPPEHYLSYKVLVGDKSDGIPGIPGVGPKRAAALIEQYGSAMDIYDAIPLPGKQKFIQALNDNKEQILINYELMDLKSFCQEAIGLANVQDMTRRLIFE